MSSWMLAEFDMNSYVPQLSSLLFYEKSSTGWLFFYFSILLSIILLIFMENLMEISPLEHTFFKKFINER